MKTEARLAQARALLTEALDIVGGAEANELRRPVTFSVLIGDAKPQDCGFMTVILRPDGLKLWWDGCEEDPWEIDWRVLRALCERDGELEDLAEQVEDARRELVILRGEGRVVATIGPSSTEEIV